MAGETPSSKGSFELGTVDGAFGAAPGKCCGVGMLGTTRAWRSGRCVARGHTRVARVRALTNLVGTKVERAANMDW